MAYGVKIMGPGGVLRLDEDETFTRVVATVKKGASFSGTFSVPDFDDTKGLFHVSYFVNKWDSGAAADSLTPMNTIYRGFVFEETSLPSLNWNNSTKVMTVTPVSWPAGWTYYNASDYVVTFIHWG